MNGNFYNNQYPNQNQSPQSSYQDRFDSSPNLFTEESYIDNILRLNKGKKVKIHITIPGTNELQDKIFDGIIEQIGKDHIVVSSPETGNWYLILIIYITFITFDERINYN